MRSFWIYILLVLGTALLLGSFESNDERIPYARFREMAEQGVLTDLQIKGDTYVAHTAPSGPANATQTIRTGRIEGAEPGLLEELDKKKVPYTRISDGKSSLPMALLWALPIAGVLLFMGSSARKPQAPNITNPALNFGKHKARLYVDKGATITFRDVAGSHEAKAELVEIVEFLRSPERYKRFGGRIPKGVLLVGPPGTGKTLLARAVAGEANVPFFSICGSEFVEMFVGVGAARVRDLFAQAREKPAASSSSTSSTPSARRAASAGPIGGNDEREQTLNQLLTEMDGFDSTSGLVVIAATNRPEILDSALTARGALRSPRARRPAGSTRAARDPRGARASACCSARTSISDDVAAQTTGLVGADLANLMNEAALLAARRHANAIAQTDLEDAIERVRRGARAARAAGSGRASGWSSPTTRPATRSWRSCLPTQDPVRKVSIVPRGHGALGYTLQQPREDRYLYGRQEILDRLVVLLGGRVAEHVQFGDMSTGAQDDLVNATDIARRMVRELGMGGDVIGLLSFDPRRSMTMDRGGYDYSEETARSVDAEVSRLLCEAEVRTKALVSEHHAALERIAQRLLEVETLTGDEVRALLHVRSPAEVVAVAAEVVEEEAPASAPRTRAAMR